MLTDSLFKMNKPENRLINHIHNEKPIIDFDFEGTVIERVKSIAGFQWSQIMRFWHIPKKAETKRKLALQLLRHSFAMHLLANGIDLKYLQEWFEHENSKTNEICTHISITAFDNIRNSINDSFEKY